MELGGGNGGFHGYRRALPQNSSGGTKASELPQMNQTTNTTDDTECTVREQDRFMPIANVIRIMRRILPQHAKISDDAKETIQECVSEFIGFITSEANDRCQREQRKTITAEDVLWAMSKLGFDDYIEPLTLYLHRYREYDGGERGSLTGEPLVKRAVDPGSYGYVTFPPVPFSMAPHHGFFGTPPMNGFLKDPSNAGPSQASVAGIDPSTATHSKKQV
ncbi:nuclear transcription factor Y subunit B-6-like [Olea europaea var. sylvestris]|uniref:Nuclear transcription factor Y subunit B-6-like n=1 Tax=Olea europaea subsp. europaea TaxID=158383 RepID=A0A8S0S875_OLEEU|nr:nuclear transcription factor Y subunit B-6-like [Olea europaea var. sylvestris]CAA2987954.1 nuclear transcription factor Y subunit B-6-like [Olea europaea subsp. europaea]